MKASYLLAIVWCGMAAAAEPQSVGAGEYVFLEPAAKVSSILTKDMPGAEKVLDRISIVPIEAVDSRSLVVSGRVVSANTGFPLERIPIFVGADDAPKLAAMTNCDGEFKFRLHVKEDRREVEIQVLPDMSGHLYVGGRVTVTPWGDMRLLGGSRRYAWKRLMEVHALKE